MRMDAIIDMAVQAKGKGVLSKKQWPLMYKVMAALQQNTGNKEVSLLDIVSNACILGINTKTLLNEVNNNYHEYYTKH